MTATPPARRRSPDAYLGFGISAKDFALGIIAKTGVAGGTGHVIDCTGSAIRALSVEGRLTVANMAIEGSARSGLIASDATTFAYLKRRPMAPAGPDWDVAVAYWRTLNTDVGAAYDKTVVLEASEIGPSVTWGTSPEDVVPITEVAPHVESFADQSKRNAAAKSLAYMGLTPGTRMQDVQIENVFIGSCTKSLIEDLRAAADVLRGRRISSDISWAIVVPGSDLLKRQAEAEGFDRVFVEAGFEWREPGCSACLAMNPTRSRQASAARRQATAILSGVRDRARGRTCSVQ